MKPAKTHPWRMGFRVNDYPCPKCGVRQRRVSYNGIRGAYCAECDAARKRSYRAADPEGQLERDRLAREKK